MGSTEEEAGPHASLGSKDLKYLKTSMTTKDKVESQHQSLSTPLQPQISADWYPLSCQSVDWNTGLTGHLG